MLIHFLQVSSLSCLLHQHKPLRWIILFSRVQKVGLSFHHIRDADVSRRICLYYGKCQTICNMKRLEGPTCVTVYSIQSSFPRHVSASIRSLGMLLTVICNRLTLCFLLQLFNSFLVESVVMVTQPPEYIFDRRYVERYTYGLVRIRHRKHLVEVRKISCFSLKHNTASQK